MKSKSVLLKASAQSEIAFFKMSLNDEVALMKAKINAGQLGTVDDDIPVARPIVVDVTPSSNTTSFHIDARYAVAESERDDPDREMESAPKEDIRINVEETKREEVTEETKREVKVEEGEKEAEEKVAEECDERDSSERSTPVVVKVRTSSTENTSFEMSVKTVESAKEETESKESDINNTNIEQGINCDDERASTREDLLESKLNVCEEDASIERGLESLANVTCLKMRQVFRPKEHFVDWRVDNFFKVSDADAGTELFDAQESTARCSTLCCFGRKTMIRINNVQRTSSATSARPDLLYLKRPYQCDPFGLFRPKLTVYSVPSAAKRREAGTAEFGVPIGMIVCPWLLSSIGVDVYNESGEFIYQIRGRRCQASVVCSLFAPCAPCGAFKRVSFDVHKVVHGVVSDTPVGCLVKFLKPSRNKGRWPFIKDQTIGANTFYLDIGSSNFEPLHDKDESDPCKSKADVAIEHKALLLAAVFLLDAMYFPATRKKPLGKRIQPLRSKILHEGKTWHRGHVDEVLETKERDIPDETKERETCL